MTHTPAIHVPVAVRRAVGFLRVVPVAILLVAGCGNVQKTVDPPSTPPGSGPVNYFAGAVAGGYSGGNGNAASPFSDANYLATYTVDDSKNTFAEFTYSFTTGNQEGPQMNYSGVSTRLLRGLLSFGIGYSNGSYGDAAGNIGAIAVNYSPPLDGNWAFELGDHSGGFINLAGMPFVPLVAPGSCPNLSKAETYQFISLPTYIGQSSGGATIAPWFPQYDTAYGRVDISTRGNAVDFANIHQFTGNGTQLTSYQDLPDVPSAITTETGACSPTFFGNTVSVPGVLSITNPGVGQTITPGAIAGIGASGLLVESNSSYGSEAANSNLSAPYQPFLGAGTGAIGLPAPSGAVSVSSLMGAQYLGVIYGGGTSNSTWTSLITSFGFSSTPSSCPSGTFQNPLYGGDFPGNNPGSSTVQAGGGFGNCDLVVDLGAQDPTNNGLFPHATVTLYPGFQGNTTNLPHSFPATAIAGQLNGKNAVFLIGMDSSGSPNQPWGLYLFQSN